MKRRYSRIFGLFFLAAFGGVSIATSIPARTVEAESNSPAASEESSAAFVFQDEFEPVDNMHHFMEYVYEPVYKELKESLKLEPADKKAWAKVKSGSMILAEASSLLAKRPSEKADGKKWSEFSAIVNLNGAKLFHAARAKDYDKAQSLFKEMSTGCAKCHEAYKK
ncbi:hypothetical protein OAE37_01495 [Pirellulaceae bacterium]|nr:hypothetical protein [Pirellulaceae bacterium]